MKQEEGMAGTAFRFMLWNENQPFRSSRCYIVANPAINDRKQWELQLEPPENAAWFYEIDDIKDWMLYGKPVRQIIYDRTNLNPRFRDLEREEVFREYIRKIVEEIPESYQSRRKYALMPSIADDDIRTRYKDAIETAIPGVTVLPEPEMVAEYFRLLKRNLELEAGKNNVLLVVDVGASTANMTLIVSRRDRTIVDIDKTGAQRDLRLRALRGDSGGLAGRWVDRRLAEILGLDKSDEILRKIEKAKVQASLGETEEDLATSSPPASLTIDRSMLASVSSELWAELRPVFEKLCERLHENQTSSRGAKPKAKSRSHKPELDAPGNTPRLIDTILLAGGTSLLPGFQEAMLTTLFPDGHRPVVLHVGSSFAIAAAAGGLAHILHNYAPPRLRESDGPNSEVFTAPLEATLPHPLLLGIKQTTGREHYVTLLDPNDPFVDDGGKRPIEGLPAMAKGSQPKMRLVPALTAGVEARRGRRFLPMHVHQSPGRMELVWDPVHERASIASDQVGGIGHLWIDASRLRRREEATPNPFDEPLAANRLAVDAAEDIILDFGMSKIVAVTADRGWISTEELERIVQKGDPYAVHLPDEVDIFDNIEINDDPKIKIPNGLDTRPLRRIVEKESIAVDDDDKALDQVDDLIASKAGSVRNALPAEPPLAASIPSPALSLARPELDSRSDWGTRVADSEFSHALTSLRDVVRIEAPHLRFDDIVVALLALAIRPIVLLAGPPGCGKSTLVRLIARILGKQAGDSFHDVAVQAHWVDDEPLFGNEGILEALLTQREAAHLVLFDEFNITRPEYYLSRLFHALESGAGTLSRNQRIAPCRIFGTLNIDESSRPPSPKVIDRCFLMELSQVSYNIEGSTDLSILNSLTPLPGLPAVSMVGASSDERIDGVLGALHAAVYDHDLRHDLLPSRRVLSDIKASLSLHHRLDLQGKKLLDRSDLVDRLIASRILVKISGAFDQLGPALDALENFAGNVEELPRTRRRLKLARQQARLGFVSPWQ